MYDTGKILLFEDEKKASMILKFCYAMTVTAGAGLVSYPLDTVRRRLMMNSGRKNKEGKAEVLYKGTADCFI